MSSTTKKPLGEATSETENRLADATLENLYRIFTIPENDATTLGKIEKAVSQNVDGFLKQHIVATDQSPSELERGFKSSKIPENPIFVSEQAEFLLDKVVSQSVHTSSPTFIGHMTSALPYFMLPLSKMMIALNQNLVKIETSKAFTPLERQVIGMLHRLVYRRQDRFYRSKIQDPRHALGVFCSNGTIANITSLWVALNRLFPRSKNFDGVAEEGLFAALEHYGYRKAVVLVSARGHYSLKKTANLLGIGKKNLIALPTDENNRIRIDDVKKAIAQIRAEKGAVVAIVGVAGTTETGNIDPLAKLAALCQAEKIHFHVDAAWGGPTLFSKRYQKLLKGIEQADSVTFDAHKQLYVPMGAGFALFKDESHLSLVEHHAEYIIRKGSRDLGRTTLEGSRPGMAMLVHSGLRIIGRKGYELLIDMGIEKAKTFANMIRLAADFELITEPELNILTYRYIPANIKTELSRLSKQEKRRLNEHLNRLTITIQKEQRDQGRSFVSRTTIRSPKYADQPTTVFRVVLANPLTQIEHLEAVLEEQRSIAKRLMHADLKAYSTDLKKAARASLTSVNLQAVHS